MVAKKKPLGMPRPAARKPAAKKPAPKPAAKKPAAKKPAPKPAKKPAPKPAKKPARKVSVHDLPVTVSIKQPVVERPEPVKLPRCAMDGHGHVALEYYRGTVISKYIAFSSEGPSKEEESTARFTADFNRPLVPARTMAEAVLSFVRALRRAYVLNDGVADVLLAAYEDALYNGAPEEKRSLEELLAQHNGLAAAMGCETIKRFKTKSAAFLALQELATILRTPTADQVRRKQDAQVAAAKRLAGLGDLRARIRDTMAVTSRSRRAPESVEKRAERARATRERGNGQQRAPRGAGIGKFCEGLIKEGKSNEQVLAAVKQQFPQAATSPSCIAWYRNKLRRAGEITA